jgi:negative elongation factor C/D
VNALSARDAILEPGIAKTFEQFLDLGGKEKEGVHILAESYVGLPHILNVMIEWLHVAGYRKREIQAMVEDHLKHLITQHFDPKKADLIFTEEGSVPSWLEEMIQFPTWRELFYQLAEQYPDCLMLKFTIKLVSDAGFQSEITSASTAQHQPEVFSSLVKSALLQITTGRVTDAQEHLLDFKVIL